MFYITLSNILSVTNRVNVSISDFANFASSETPGLFFITSLDLFRLVILLGWFIKAIDSLLFLLMMLLLEFDLLFSLAFVGEMKES